MKRDAIWLGLFIVALILIQVLTGFPATNLIGWLFFNDWGHWVLYALITAYIIILIRRSDSDSQVSANGQAIQTANAEIKAAADKKAAAEKSAAALLTGHIANAIAGVFEAVNGIRDANKGRIIENLNNVSAQGIAEGKAGPTLIQWAGQLMTIIMIGMAIVIVMVFISHEPPSATPKWNPETHNAVAFCTQDDTPAYAIIVAQDESTFTPELQSTQCYVLSEGDSFESNFEFRGVLYNKVQKQDGTFVLLNNGYLFKEVP